MPRIVHRFGFAAECAPPIRALRRLPSMITEVRQSSSKEVFAYIDPPTTLTVGILPGSLTAG